MHFRLYDELAAKAAIHTEDIDLSEMTRTITSLNKLGKDTALPHFEIIYALIIHHSNVKGIPISRNTPCLGGSVCDGGRGVSYSFGHTLHSGFDLLLQKIIALYVSSIVKTS